MELNKIYEDDSLMLLRQFPDQFFNTCVTSPPYWNLRDYGVPGQLGLEDTPEEYIANMVEIFREVRRTLRDDGTLWVNIGDSYAGGGNGGGGSFAKDGIRTAEPGTDKNKATRHGKRGAINGIKSKDMVGIPWMLAFALRADGWYLRSDIIWSKPNPMPESVIDRPTKAHEYLFLLSKSPQYYYDSYAIREPIKESSVARLNQDIKNQNGSYTPSKGNGNMKAVAPRSDKQRGHSRRHAGFNDRWDGMSKQEQQATGANKRTVWTVATQAFPEAHFATFPEKLIEPCILAGSPENGIVLDPFMGAGTTALVASRLNRKFVGIELNPQYIDMAYKRIDDEVRQLKINLESV